MAFIKLTTYHGNDREQTIAQQKLYDGDVPKTNITKLKQIHARKVNESLNNNYLRVFRKNCTADLSVDYGNGKFSKQFVTFELV